MPFLCVVLFSCIASTTWYHEYQRQYWETRLSNNIGMDVRLGEIEFLSPYEFRARTVRCMQPETGHEVIRIDEVKGLTQQNGWALELISSDVHGDQVPDALGKFHDWFICRPKKSAGVVAMMFRDIRVHSHGSQRTLPNVKLGLVPTETKSTFTFTIGGESRSLDAPMRLEVVRNHTADTPSTSWDFDSANIPIPCSILVDQFPELNQLGSDASFVGRFIGAMSDHRSDAQIQGTFSNVDWERASAVLGSPIRSRGVLRLVDAKLKDGKILEASGSIEMQEGKIHYPWLRQAIASLELQDNLPKDTSDVLLPMQRAAFHFQIGHQGFALRGAIPTQPNAAYTISMELMSGVVTGQDQKRFLSMSQLSDCLLSTTAYVGGPRNPRTSKLSDDLSAYLARVLPWPTRSFASNDPFLSGPGEAAAPRR